MYLLCRIRPNIVFPMGHLSKHNLDPRIGHMKVAKKVICYLKGMMHLGFIYGTQTKDVRKTKAPIALFSFRLIRYGDSSYVRDLEDKKLVMGYYYFFNRAIISWCSKK